MWKNSCLNKFAALVQRCPDALAEIRGSEKYPEIRGELRLYQTQCGVLCAAEVFGLPRPPQACKSPIFAFHIHSGELCSGDEKDAFSQAMAHYNPENCEHPYHAGDLPPLFSNDGNAVLIFLTDRFSVCEIIGKTVIIHSRPDDFTTQPSGNSGEKIACGIIKKFQK